ncbi:hypothetical protein CTEN210_07097 [Chaetoceros tenuissimus]|uniref:Uncharacterized protein n=1 Tax=Chaetoceros tenuissimus TaxID=426638 RepID=A0AAD3CR33_9STRA|nr:hypothetical protein CTEN210_07097 [Chaetoceros tenuissimus]
MIGKILFQEKHVLLRIQQSLCKTTNMIAGYLFLEWRKNMSRNNLIKKNITQTEAFDFGVSDIARLRQEMAILIKELHGIYKRSRGNRRKSTNSLPTFRTTRILTRSQMNQTTHQEDNQLQGKNRIEISQGRKKKQKSSNDLPAFRTTRSMTRGGMNQTTHQEDNQLQGKNRIEISQGRKKKQNSSDDLPALRTTRILTRSQMNQTTHQEYNQLLDKKKIEVFQLGTYQGRKRSSTNGCTVISPLVVVNHLQSVGCGIPDQKINEVIDEIAPIILSRVRRKHGYSGYSYIWPTDVHSFLMVDEKLLEEKMFVGIETGNIFDSQKINAYIDMLQNGEASTKRGFFLEKQIRNQ